MTISISQLYLYPVKSLRGMAVQEARLRPTGFQWDRHWMIIKPDGGFISQRQFPKMILIHTHLTEDALVLSKLGMNTLCIPLRYPPSPSEYFTAKIWKDNCQVIDEGEQASQWLTQAIGTPKPVRLVRMLEQYQRPQSKAHLLGKHTHTLFADAAPYLITNELSLHIINQALQDIAHQPVTMANFRPNIAITGLAAFYEHRIKSLFGQGKHHYRFQLCYPCQRCVVPTINTETGIRHPEQQPFHLLTQLNPMPDNPKAPAFGENAILSEGENSIIRVGDLLLENNH
jgi:uncharacterized protein YcbX